MQNPRGIPRLHTSIQEKGRAAIGLALSVEKAPVIGVFKQEVFPVVLFEKQRSFALGLFIGLERYFFELSRFVINPLDLFDEKSH